MKRFQRLALGLTLAIGAVVLVSGYSKPNTYDTSSGQIVFKDQYLYSPHSWVIVKAIELLRTDGYVHEADVAQKYLLPMLEGVTFNDVWGDADLAGGSVLDYYVPDKPDQDYGFGCVLDGVPLLPPYKNCTQDFKAHSFYRYGNAAEQAEYRYEYAKRILQGHWGDGTDPRDMMAGWVIDDIGIFGQGQDDPMDGRWASGTAGIDAATSPGGTHSRFGDGQTPATAIQDLLEHHTNCQIMFPAPGASTDCQVIAPITEDDFLSKIYVPTPDVFSHGSEWLDDHFDNADDVEAYNGYDGHGNAVYASWTTDAGGKCHGGADCAAPMVVRLPVNSPAHAFFQLGWAIHLLEDNTTPVHTIDGSYTTYQVHNDIEGEADDVLGTPITVNAGAVRDLLPAPNLQNFLSLIDYPVPACTPTGPGGLVCLPEDYPPPDCTSLVPDPSTYYKTRWYANSLLAPGGEGPAHEYTRSSAEMMHTFIPYISCMNTEGNRNWSSMGVFTALGLDLAIKSTAGLIRQFVDEADPDGRMYGAGYVDAGGRHHHFAFRASQLQDRDFGRFEYWSTDAHRGDGDDDYDREWPFRGERESEYGRNHRSAVNHFEATAVNSAVFSDDPAFTPGRASLHHPQPAVDTVAISGVGRWNGKPGYTFDIDATDRGEPGRHRDTFSLFVKDSHGVMVAAFSGPIDGGNIESTRLDRWTKAQWRESRIGR